MLTLKLISTWVLLLVLTAHLCETNTTINGVIYNYKKIIRGVLSSVKAGKSLY